MPIDNAIYTARATSTGGRAGTSSTSDGRLTIDLSTPTELGGDGGAGTNPEQLFAAGYSACFIGAIKAVAGAQNLDVPDNVSITSDVAIGPMTGKEGAFSIDVSLAVSIPGMESATAEKLVADAHEVCPYSNATRGNVDVKLTVA